jgi:hypothetical protein
VTVAPDIASVVCAPLPRFRTLALTPPAPLTITPEGLLVRSYWETVRPPLLELEEELELLELELAPPLELLDELEELDEAPPLLEVELLELLLDELPEVPPPPEPPQAARINNVAIDPIENARNIMKLLPGA